MTPEEIAASLSEAQVLLLSRHAEGWKSSLYRNPHVDRGQSPFWESMDCTYFPPHFHVREALIRKGLIEPYNDAAGITPLGLAVRQLLEPRHD